MNKQDVFRVALYAGEIMLKNGAEIYRVEDTIIRICNSRKFNHVNSFVTPTGIFLSDYKFDGITFMKRIKSRGIDLSKISKVNDFSREFVCSDMSMEDSLKILKNIDNESKYPELLRAFFTGLASACFAVILGANLADFFAALIISIAAILLGNRIDRISDTPFLATIASGSLISIFSILSTQLGFGKNLDMIIVGAIMPWLPGVSLTNGLRDFISGDLLAGMSRIGEAVLISLSIAIGVGIVLKLWINFFGGVI